MANGTRLTANGSVITTQPSQADVLALLAALQAENATLKANAAKQAAKRILKCKVSEKGCLSLYGLRRMPTSLYIGEWERVIAFMPQIQQFMKDNAHLLSRK